jgi:hypothetical protein
MDTPFLICQGDFLLLPAVSTAARAITHHWATTHVPTPSVWRHFSHFDHMIDTFLVKLGLKLRNLFLQSRRFGGIWLGFGQLALQFKLFLIQISSQIMGFFDESFPFLLELLVLLFAHLVIVSWAIITSMMPTLAMVAPAATRPHATMGKGVYGETN